MGQAPRSGILQLLWFFRKYIVYSNFHLSTHHQAASSSIIQFCIIIVLFQEVHGLQFVLNHRLTHTKQHHRFLYSVNFFEEKYLVKQIVVKIGSSLQSRVHVSECEHSPYLIAASYISVYIQLCRKVPSEADWGILVKIRCTLQSRVHVLECKQKAIWLLSRHDSSCLWSNGKHQGLICAFSVTNVTLMKFWLCSNSLLDHNNIMQLYDSK